MKLTTLLLVVTLFQLHANETLSQNKKISIDMQDITIENVLNEIELITDYKFLYEKNTFQTDKIVKVSVKNEKLSKVLNKLFRDSNVSIIFLEKQIHIKQNKESDVPNEKVEPIKVETKIQQLQVSGIVTDEDGEPLPGASILEKGTTNGTESNFDGNFSLDVSNANATLVVSFIGYLPQEIAVAGQEEVAIALLEDASNLEEVVIIGYGTARRKDISGAVSTLRLEDSPIALSPNTNALQTLQGTVAGVNIGTQNSPGETPTILIRGQNSINGSNNPLIVLDGIIYLGSMADIHPDDIAVIDVLKDASSAAVYGSRAANGVIVITSKRGKSDTPVIRYNTSVGVNTWPNSPDMMNRERYTEKLIAQNPAYNTPEDIVFSDAFASTLWDQGVETDWYDLIKRNGKIQNHKVDVSGQADRVNYYFSGGYSNHEGAIVGDDYERISVRTRLNVDVTDWLEVGLDGTYNNNDYSGQGARVDYAYHNVPWTYPYRYDGMPVNPQANTGTLLEKFPSGQSMPNPLWGTDGTIDNIDKTNFYRLATYAVVNIPKVDGLSYRFNYSINSNSRKRDGFHYEDYYVGEATSEPYYDRYSPAELGKRLNKANGYNNRTDSYTYVMDNIINYKKEFGDHYVDATAVATRDYSYLKLVSAIGSDYSLNGNTLLGVDGIHKAAVQKINSNVVERSNIGYLGRLSYAYKDKYHLMATMRRDGASVFGADQKWGNFPSVGVAWTASEEDFISGIDKLSYLKLKASYGKNGNQGLDPYQTLAQVQSGLTFVRNGRDDVTHRYEFGDAPSTILYGVEQSNLGSPTLGWETTTAFNGGFQSAWFNDHVFLDLDFYFSSTSDQIFRRQIPVMTGFSSILSSLGQVDNKGIEISLRTINIDKKDLKWSSNLIFWQNRNKVVELYGDDADGDGKEDDDLSNDLFIGEPLHSIYGYEYIGVVQEDDTEYITNVGAQPGDPMFNDISGPDGVPDGIITADHDRKILGNRQENFRLSLANTVEYKNFSLYVLLTGIFGGGKDNYFLKENPKYNSFIDDRGNQVDHDWWTPENKSEEYLRPDFNGNRYLGLQSRGFVRIQDVNLSYKLPKGMLSSIGLNSLELYGSVKNLYTFTNWFGGGDPEEGRAVHSGTYPVPTTYLMGLKVSF